MGTIDTQYLDGTNWDGGLAPPNGYDGVITIQANCEMPLDYPFFLSTNGELIIETNVELENR